jgi:hypothetical protein
LSEWISTFARAVVEVLTMIISNEVQAFRAAVGKYGVGRYDGLTIGNEVSLLRRVVLEEADV